MEKVLLKEANTSRRSRKRAAGALLSATIALGVQNHQLINDARILFEDDKKVPVPRGCNVENPSFSLDEEEKTKVIAPENDPKPTDEILRAVGGGQSAARSFPVTSMGGQFESKDFYVGHFDTKISEHYDPKTGITFKVASDQAGGFSLNEKDLFELSVVAMENWEIYEHEAVRDVMRCMYRDFIVDRKFEGEHEETRIPSQPDACLNGLFVVRLGNGQSTSDCHTYGFTMPDVEIGIGPLTIDKEGYVVATAGNNNPEVASQRITKYLLHEWLHRFLRLQGAQQRLDPEERFVDYVVMSAEREELFQHLRPVDYTATQEA